MGSPLAFENRRAELAEIGSLAALGLGAAAGARAGAGAGAGAAAGEVAQAQEQAQLQGGQQVRPLSAVSDDEVVESYRDMVRPRGLLSRYLSQGW